MEAGLSDWVPERPPQKVGLTEPEVAFWQDQVTLVDWPAVIVIGLAEMLAEGGEAGGLTVTVTLFRFCIRVPNPSYPSK